MANKGRPTIKADVIRRIYIFKNDTIAMFHEKIKGLIQLNTLADYLYTDEEKRLIREVKNIFPNNFLYSTLHLISIDTGSITADIINITDLNNRVRKYIYKECENHELINDFTARAKEIDEEIAGDILFLERCESEGFAKYCAKYMPYLNEFFIDKKIFDKVSPVKEEYQIILKGIKTALLLREVGVIK